MALWLYGIICISVVLMGYFIQQFEDYQPKSDWITLTMTGAASAFGMVCPYKANITSNRIFFGSLLLGNIVFGSNVLSFILRTMTSTVYEKQVESVQEVMRRSYELAGDEFALQHLIIRNEVD